MSTEARVAKQLKVPLQPPAENTTRHLLAFWPHFALHRRPSDRSGEMIISVFPPECPYPVWHREEWLAHAEPPSTEYDNGIGFFDNLWRCFQHSPIPHNLGLSNVNSDYTDDVWHSRNAYLCHKGLELENCFYCYRVVSSKDCQYCIF